MAPRGQIDEEVKKLQAVIIADSFNENFRPLSLESPRVLMPVVNIPMIEYSLEFLESNEIEEIFVFCCYKADVIEAYISNSSWKNRVQLITSTDCMSVGDALRTINGTGLLKGEFVLCSGDIVSNVKIGSRLREFREKREKDKSLVMDMFFKIAPPGHRTRTALDDLIVGLDSATNQVLYYEDDRDCPEISFDASLMDQSKSVQLRHDLLDCGLFLCALEVLYEFEDNFDYVDISRSFIADVLTSEITNYKVTATLIDLDYAARVQCLKTYDSVSRDIVHRWTFPFVPETNIFHPEGGRNAGYKYQRNCIYRGRDVSVQRTSKLVENVVVGEDTTIAEGSIISNSIIGSGCRIGANVRIEGAYIWDHVEVCDNAVIQDCLIASYAKVGESSTVSSGCVVSYNVEIGVGFNVPPFTRLTTCRRSAALSDDLYDDDDVQPQELMRKESEVSNWKDADVGAGGVGKRWPDESHKDGNTIAWNQIELPPVEGEDEASSSEDDEGEIEAGDSFDKEVIATVRDGLEKNSSAANHALEINSLKFAYDATFEDCYRAFGPVLFEQIGTGSSVKETVNKFAKFFSDMAELCIRFVTTNKNRVEFINILTEYIDNLPEGQFNLRNTLVFNKALETLYNEDIITEDALSMWAKEGSKAWVAKAKPFLEWLQNASEEDSEEESD